METVLTVRCRDCGAKYRLHDYTPGDDLPDCPKCGRIEESKLDLTKPVRIVQGGSPTSQAVKIAESIATEQYGLTNFKTGKLADGEAMAMTPLTPTQKIMDDAWKNAGRSMGVQTGPLIDSVRASGMGAIAARDTQNTFKVLQKTKLKLIDQTGRPRFK